MHSLWNGWAIPKCTCVSEYHVVYKKYIHFDLSIRKALKMLTYPPPPKKKPEKNMDRGIRKRSRLEMHLGVVYVENCENK